MTQFRNQWRFDPPQSDDPKVLGETVRQMSAKLNAALLALERNSSGSTNTVLTINSGGSGGGGGGGGSSGAADNVRVGTQVLTAAGGVVSFSSPLTGYSNVFVWAWMSISDGEGGFFTFFPPIDPSTITLSQFTVGAIAGGVGGTIYYTVFGYN